MAEPPVTAAGEAFDITIDGLQSALVELRTAPYRTPVLEALEVIDEAVARGHRLLLFGNGGSAADADHLAAEFVGRCVRDSPPWPAMALNTSPGVLTALANDYGYEQVFARQVAAFARPGDVVIGITTSGRSANVLAGLRAAQREGARAVALVGRAGLVEPVADLEVRVPADSTARIQELHKFVGHFWATTVESRGLGRS